MIDAQGLLKSVMIAAIARGPTVGYGFRSAREPLASLFYGRRVNVTPNVHAIEKMRELFAVALNYTQPMTSPDFALGVRRSAMSSANNRATSKQIMFLHGTTWATKHWPVAHWKALAALVRDAGFKVLVPHGNEIERLRAHEIASIGGDVVVMAPMAMPALMNAIGECAGVVAVDTGLGHLATALTVPIVGLYGPTNPGLTGPVGERQSVIASDHLPCIPCLARTCAVESEASMMARGALYPPCLAALQPAIVWQTLQGLLRREQVTL